MFIFDLEIVVNLGAVYEVCTILVFIWKSRLVLLFVVVRVVVERGVVRDLIISFFK